MINAWNAAGYITSSRYRRAVCEHLYMNGPALPSELARATDLAQPHVSRALSELRDRDIVELLVPESQQKGRLYGLTDQGIAALDRLERGRRPTETVVTVDREEFPYPGLVDYLLDRYESTLQAVAVHDESVTRVFFASPEVADEDGSADAEEVLANLRMNRAERDAGFDDVPTGEFQFLVQGFENLTLVRLFTADGREISISIGGEFDLPLRSFVHDCQDELSVHA